MYISVQKVYSHFRPELAQCSMHACVEVHACACARSRAHRDCGDPSDRLAFPVLQPPFAATKTHPPVISMPTVTTTVTTTAGAATETTTSTVTSPEPAADPALSHANPELTASLFPSGAKNEVRWNPPPVSLLRSSLPPRARALSLSLSLPPSIFSLSTGAAASLRFPARPPLLSLCLSVSLSLCLSVSLSLCLSVSLSLCLSVSLSLSLCLSCRSVALSLCRSVSLSLCLSVSLSLCLSVSLSLCRPVALSLCRSVSVSAPPSFSPPPPAHLVPPVPPQAKASCYCGKVKMTIKTDTPVFAAFCHCVSCRKTHSAPIYQCVYVKPDEITVEGGMDESNPNLASKGGEAGHLGPQGGGEGAQEMGITHRRVFCNDCGSTMFNDLNILEENALGMEAQKIIGTFPVRVVQPRAISPCRLPRWAGLTL
eukprot:SAG22_NODE_2371_length_2645_cov_4.857816_1_plen_426_part_00